MSNKANWNVYLSGEIHTKWRDDIISNTGDKNLAITFLVPELSHEHSDHCGEHILGEEASNFWKDHKGAKVNAIRTRTMIERSDVVVVRFGDKYRQWNAAFDAGFAAALGKSLIVMHSREHQHALKEVDAAALAVVENTGQVVQILKYVLGKKF